MPESDPRQSRLVETALALLMVEDERNCESSEENTHRICRELETPQDQHKSDDDVVNTTATEIGTVSVHPPKTQPQRRPHGWIDPQDSRFRDAFRAFAEWLDAIRPPLSERHPRYREAMQKFDQMDSCWMEGDLVGFRRAIENIKPIGKPKQSDMFSRRVADVGGP